MRKEYNKNATIAGISKRNRGFLDKLNRETKGPFSIGEAAKILDIKVDKTRRLIAYWVARGWLTRIKKGLFMTVPLGAVSPSNRRGDPWIVATIVFKPCYIGGWSACEHWGLTEQIFKDIVVFSTRKPQRKKLEIQGTTYIVKNIKKEKLFGAKTVWREQTRINVSDPSRTVVDILNEPYLGGGIRNASNILKEYFEGDNKDEFKLLDYIGKMKNKTIYKRLGYLVETLKIDAPEVIASCKKKMSSGYSNLDPSLPSKGKFLRKWNLRINAAL
jgi:predicted transcriptional regulator of viral defense system